MSKAMFFCLPHDESTMKITPIHTPYFEKNQALEPFLRAHLPSKILEESVVAITSKIISLSQGRLIDAAAITLHEILEQECDWVDPINSYEQIFLTQYQGRILLNAGIDTSNVRKGYLLLPHHPFDVAQKIGHFLSQQYGLKKVGVIITDSRTQPFFRGAIGAPIAWWGFHALNSWIGEKDLMGNILQATTQNVVHALAASAVYVMGEARESTPLALIENIPHIRFSQERPLSEDIENIFVPFENDIYAKLFLRQQLKK